jgi:ubiquinone/menaquinone biosynthesis C-methylase UbiE
MSFDLLAPHYRWMEFALAGEKLQRCRTAFLDETKAARNVLILGEGNGRFLAECRGKLTEARITCVDQSARMLWHAQKRLERLGLNRERVSFLQADALDWSPPENTFDLVVTHFFLDCFRPEQVEQLIQKLSRAATQRASWLLADFQLPASGWRQCRARIILWMMYLFFRAVTDLPARRLSKPDDFLRANGFVLAKRKSTEWGLLHSDRWSRV